MEKKPLVGIVMGSDSDLPVMREAARALEELGVPWELTIASAHRTPERASRYAGETTQRGLKIIIAGAGGAAHLAGVLAAQTTLPVIGVPMQSAALNGLDSLYATVQMPAGIPVATVAIDGARNAGLLAAEILALSDPELAGRLKAQREQQARQVEEKAARLAQLGVEGYLEGRK